MRILRSLRGLGVFQEVRDYGRALAKATGLLDMDQMPAAVTCLEDCLQGERAGEDEGDVAERAACHLLLARCRIEGGLLRGDAEAVRVGIASLLEVEAVFPRYVAGRPSVRLELLEVLGRYLGAALEPGWRPGTDKSAFRPLVSRLALELSNLRDVKSVDRLCSRGLAVFQGDAGLLFWQGDARIAQGDLVAGLARVTEAVLAGGGPASMVEVLALMDLVIRQGERELHQGAEALKGEVYRRADRWDEAAAAYRRAD